MIDEYPHLDRDGGISVSLPDDTDADVQHYQSAPQNLLSVHLGCLIDLSIAALPKGAVRYPVGGLISQDLEMAALR